MAKASILAGSTSQSLNVFIQDSSSTTGAGLSGLAYNSAGLAAYYTFTGANATATAITLATLAGVTSAWSSGGFIEIDATHMKGLYRLDIPNAALAAASGRAVYIMLYGGTNMAPLALEIELTAWNDQDAVRGGMTALPNAAANAAGGLPVSIAGALDMDDIGADVDAIQTSTAGLTFTAANKVDANVIDIAGQAATLDANNLLKVDIEDINGSATGAVNLGKTTNAIGRGTCTTGGSVTSVPTSAFAPSAGIVSGQFIGRVILFDADTTTDALQGQSSPITANTSGATPVFTVATMTTAPASGDTFSVI